MYAEKLWLLWQTYWYCQTTMLCLWSASKTELETSRLRIFEVEVPISNWTVTQKQRMGFCGCYVSQNNPLIFHLSISWSVYCYDRLSVNESSVTCLFVSDFESLFDTPFLLLNLQKFNSLVTIINIDVACGWPCYCKICCALFNCFLHVKIVVFRGAVCNFSLDQQCLFMGSLAWFQPRMTLIDFFYTVWSTRGSN